MIIQENDWFHDETQNHYVKVFSREEVGTDDPLVQVYKATENDTWISVEVQITILNNGAVALSSNQPFKAKVVIL